MSLRFQLLAGCLILAPAIGRAQQAPPPPPVAAPAALPAIVSYSVASLRREPPQFSLTIDLLGHATYHAADAPSAQGEPPAPYEAEFEVSAATRDRVFALAQATEYFAGDFEFRKHAVADTGRKTLVYRDAQRQSSTTYNWSQNKHIQQLTDLFESIALTQGYARRLAFLRRFDKLGLDAVLKRMEELNQKNFLGELQAIAPVLRQIAADPGVMKLARDRAARLADQVAAPGLTLAAPRP